MEQRMLGQTGLMVSRLCFGTLTLGPLQRNLAPEIGGRLLLSALEQGVNFFDTAQLYGTYPHLAWALSRWSEPVVVVSKSYAFTGEAMAAAVDEARRVLVGPHVRLVFLLHEQESAHTLRGHRAALDYLVEAKARGLVAAVGVSTHCIAGVRAAAAAAEIDVISPLLNKDGIGIADGSAAAMQEACAEAAARGRGLFGMKPLGGGHLLANRTEALAFALAQPFFHAVAVGMQSEAELAWNLAFFAGSPLPACEIWSNRHLHIDSWCSGCGRCVQVCGQEALRLEAGRAVVDKGRCVFCGYCGAACPEFAIKVI